MADPPDGRPTDDLTTLLTRAQSGDGAALAELLRRYERRVRLAARALLRPHLRHLLDTFDLVQSVHRALLPGLKSGRYSFASDDQLVGLAVTILRNKVRRTARKAARPLPEPPPARGEQPADRLGSQELIEHVRSVLTEIDKRILDLRLKDYSTVEIAAEIGCSPAVLRARLSRLRARLRDDGVTDLL